MIYYKPPKNFAIQFEAAGCFCEYGGEILLLQRNNDDTFGGHWALPAGGLETGEDVVTAMIREIEEEVGLQVKKDQLQFLEKMYVQHDDKQFIFHFFQTQFSRRPAVQINQEEHQSFLWCTPHKTLSLRLVDDMDTCLKKFYKIP